MSHRAWGDALASIGELAGRIASHSAAMRKETRLAARVDRGEVVGRLRAALDKCKTMLD